MEPEVGRCSNEYDLVSMVDWVEEKPTIFIDFRDSPTQPGRLVCYNGTSLKKWLGMEDNTFAKWVKKPLAKEIDSSGRGGHPDFEHQYIKLYTGEFIISDDLSKKLLKSKGPTILTANYESTERIGNLRGTIGVSELHGQYPGYRTYKLEGDVIEEKVEKPKIKRSQIPDEDLVEDTSVPSWEVERLQYEAERARDAAREAERARDMAQLAFERAVNAAQVRAERARDRALNSRRD